MPLQEKIDQIEHGKNVRPPKKWWNGMYKIVSSDPKYASYSKTRKSQITAGIWHKEYSKKAKIGIVRHLQAGVDGVPHKYIPKRFHKSHSHARAQGEWERL